MMRWFLLFVLRKLMAFAPEETLTKVTDRDRMMAYKSAFQITELRDVKRNLIRQHERTIAGRAENEMQIWFHRGIIFAHQMELQSMKAA